MTVEAALRPPGHRLVAHGALEPLRSFNLAGVLDPVDVHAAIAVGRICGETHPEVLLAAALTVRGTRFGHVCIDLGTVRETVAVDGVPVEVLDSLPWPHPAGWMEAVRASPLTGDGEPERPLVWSDGLLYLERYWAYEQRVVAQISQRVGAPPPLALAIEPILDRLFPSDDAGDMQRKAAERALTGRFTVIAGGPGTGKTHTVARLIAALIEAAVNDGARPPAIAVAAPTGKAAARLTEQIRETARTVPISAEARDRLAATEASTLHRLLGWHPERGRFAYHRDNPLPHDVVIVDEMSMVPLTMTAKLLEAARSEAAIVLVGDPDQLVSIEAGTVLGDLVGAGATGGSALSGRVVTLQRVFRYGEDSPIAVLADAIRTGDADAAIESLRDGGEKIRWFDTADREPATIGELTEPMVAHARRLIAHAASGNSAAALDEVGRLAVLCAHRRGDLGVEHWVPWIERHARHGTGSWEMWYPGRPVMVLTNDYRLNVFNGDIGVVVNREEGIAVAFPGPDGPRFIGPAHLPAHETVHAMTIHKSQGSQFDEVIVLVPGEESRLLSRELLYTAVTRARARVTVVGTQQSIRAAIGRRVSRSSGLVRRCREKASLPNWLILSLSRRSTTDPWPMSL